MDNAGTLETWFAKNKLVTVWLNHIARRSKVKIVKVILVKWTWIFAITAMPFLCRGFSKRYHIIISWAVLLANSLVSFYQKIKGDLYERARLCVCLIFCQRLCTLLDLCSAIPRNVTIACFYFLLETVDDIFFECQLS